MANKTDGGSTLAQDLSFTPDERAELDRAKAMPITFDEDCPETTPERALRFRRVNPIRLAQVVDPYADPDGTKSVWTQWTG